MPASTHIACGVGKKQGRSQQFHLGVEYGGGADKRVATGHRRGSRPRAGGKNDWKILEKNFF